MAATPAFVSAATAPALAGESKRTAETVEQGIPIAQQAILHAVIRNIKNEAEFLRLKGKSISVELFVKGMVELKKAYTDNGLAKEFPSLYNTLTDLYSSFKDLKPYQKSSDYQNIIVPMVNMLSNIGRKIVVLDPTFNTISPYEKELIERFQTWINNTGSIEKVDKSKLKKLVEQFFLQLVISSTRDQRPPPLLVISHIAPLELQRLNAHMQSQEFSVEEMRQLNAIYGILAIPNYGKPDKAKGYKEVFIPALNIVCEIARKMMAGDSTWDDGVDIKLLNETFGTWLNETSTLKESKKLEIKEAINVLVLALEQRTLARAQGQAISIPTQIVPVISPTPPPVTVRAIPVAYATPISEPVAAQPPSITLSSGSGVSQEAAISPGRSSISIIPSKSTDLLGSNNTASPPGGAIFPSTSYLLTDPNVSVMVARKSITSEVPETTGTKDSNQDGREQSMRAVIFSRSRTGSQSSQEGSLVMVAGPYASVTALPSPALPPASEPQEGNLSPASMEHASEGGRAFAPTDRNKTSDPNTKDDAAPKSPSSRSSAILI